MNQSETCRKLLLVLREVDMHSTSGIFCPKTRRARYGAALWRRDWAILEEHYYAACRDLSDITLKFLKAVFGGRER